MSNEKKDDIDIEKKYGDLCRASKEEFISKQNLKKEGLTDDEVNEKFYKYGHNEVTQTKQKKWYNYLISCRKTKLCKYNCYSSFSYNKHFT